MDGIIIGAGIGGLASAIALQKRGIAARVFEAAPSLAPVGAGIIVPPNAMNILARLGLAEHVRDTGKPIEGFAILDRQGKAISKISAHFAQNGASYQSVAIHRGQLQQVLLGALLPDSISLGKACAHIELQTGRAEAKFHDGTSASGDFVIGADGIRSSVRQAIFPDGRLRYSGQTCWRGVATLTLPEQWAHQFTEIWGRCGVFGFVAINASQVYWYATQQAPAAGLDDLHQVKQQLIERHGTHIEQAAELIARTEASAIIRNDLFDLAPLKSWSRGCAVLAGDAAHAMLPNLGQGGAQAIEDSWVLAEMLQRYASPASAFAQYQRVRYKRVRKIVDISRKLAQVSGFCNATLSEIRDRLFRATPGFVSAQQFRGVYGLPY